MASPRKRQDLCHFIRTCHLQHLRSGLARSSPSRPPNPQWIFDRNYDENLMISEADARWRPSKIKATGGEFVAAFDDWIGCFRKTAPCRGTGGSDPRR